MAEDLNALEPVEVEHDGRILAGVGVTPEELQAVMERRSPEANQATKTEGTPAGGTGPETTQPAPAGEPATDAPIMARDESTGRFVKEPKGSQRFSKLTSERDDAVKRAEAAEAELTRLRESAKTRQDAPQATNGNGATPAPARAPIVAPAYAPTRAKPNLDELGTTYKTYEDYTEDLADWKAEQRLAQSLPQIDARMRSAIEADRYDQQFKHEILEASGRGRKAYNDWDTTIKASLVDIPWPLAVEIVRHPQSEHLQYALAKDSTAAQQIVDTFKNNPLSAGFLLERLLNSSAPAASPASTARAGVTTNAPAPYQPVGTGTHTTVPPLDKLADNGDDYDTSGYRERRAADRTRGGTRR